MTRNGIDARKGQDGETRLGRNDESPVGEADAPELLRRISTLTAEVEELHVMLAEARDFISPCFSRGEQLLRNIDATLTKGEGDKLS